MEGLSPDREPEQSEVGMREQKTEDSEQRTKHRGRRQEKTAPAPIPHRRSERGIVLVMVIVLSAVALLIMTALIYMITMGTQISGLQKRYKTALEAGIGGGDIFYQVIATRAQSSDISSLTANLNSFNLNAALTTPGACSGLYSGATHTGLAAKLMTPSASWAGCNSSLAINPADPSSYDMRMQLGTTMRYNVYAKIVATTDGNSGGDLGLVGKGVVSANTGEVAVTPIPYLYAIEVVAENTARQDERAKLSVLYQY